MRIRITALAVTFSKPTKRADGAKPTGGTMPTRELVGNTGSAAKAGAVASARAASAPNVVCRRMCGRDMVRSVANGAHAGPLARLPHTGLQDGRQCGRLALVGPAGMGVFAVPWGYVTVRDPEKWTPVFG